MGLLNALKVRASSTAHGLGYDIHRSRQLCATTLLSSLGIDLLVDVGANKGQYALSQRANGYKGEILSFEPMSSEHAELLALSRKDPHWIIADRMAIGDQSGEIELNLAANSASSSLLPMLHTHLAAAPGSGYIATELVAVQRLDDVLKARAVGRRIFLKLDVQGFERHVLNGAQSTLANALGLQLEMSLLPLYEGETLMPEMHQFLRDKGFELWDLQSAFRDAATGRLLQVDAVFRKREYEAG